MEEDNSSKSSPSSTLQRRESSVLLDFDAGEALNVTEWINEWLEENNDSENVDSVLSGLLMKLQQDSQSLKTKLEERMAQLLASIPRALREVERIGRDSDALRKSLGNLEGMVAEDPPEGDGQGGAQQKLLSTVSTLEHLHTIKSNLDNTLGVVEQSANWNRLVREVEDSFASRDLVGVAERLGSLRKSLELLDSMPDADGRKGALIRMEQRLETLIGPGLRDAINGCLKSEEANESGNVEEQEQVLQGYVSIFDKLGRLDHLCKDFAEARAAFVQEDWEDMQKKAQEKEWDFNDWVTRFFEKATSSLERENARCVRVFGSTNAPTILRKVISDSFSIIAPNLQRELSMLPIEYVVQVYEKTCQFSDQLLEIAKRGQDDATVSQSSQETVEEERKVVEQAVLPFIPFFDSYRDVEFGTLQQELEARAGKVSTRTIVSLLGDPTVFDITQDSLNRCARFSQGVKYSEVLEAIDMFWADFVSKCSQVLRSQDLGDISGFKVTEKDWEDRIFLSLKQLQAVAAFTDRVEGFKETQLKTILASEVDSSSMTGRICATSILSPSQPVDLSTCMKKSESGVQELILIAQTSVYEAMLGPVLCEWDPLARMKVWGVNTNKEASALGTDEETISDFGGPLKYMTSVTKHLVTLVELLEPFAATEKVSSHLLPDALQLGKQDRQKVEVAFGLESGSRVVKFDAEMVNESDDDGEQPDLFSPPWLSMIASGTFNSMLLEIVKIPKLGEKGKVQLAADLGYLDNVLSMIAAQDPLLLHLQALLEQSKEEVKEAVGNPQSSPYPLVDQLVFDKITNTTTTA